MNAEDPKKSCGDAKPSVRFMPLAPILDVARVFESGAAKYGLRNWEAQPIAYSTYYSAIFRHLIEWFECGEDADAESGQHPLAHVVASCLIVMHSTERGTAVDDRRQVEVKTGAQL